MASVPQSLKQAASKALALADKEVGALKTLHAESEAIVRRMAERDAQLRTILDRAYAYAVFPSVGKASAVVGAAFGKDGDDILQCLAHLLDKVVAFEFAGGIPADMAADEHRAARRRYAIGIADRIGPAFRLQDLMHRWSPDVW